MFELTCKPIISTWLKSSYHMAQNWCSFFLKCHQTFEIFEKMSVNPYDVYTPVPVKQKNRKLLCSMNKIYGTSTKYTNSEKTGFSYWSSQPYGYFRYPLYLSTYPFPFFLITVAFSPTELPTTGSVSVNENYFP
jgi:hypothetical protein